MATRIPVTSPQKSYDIVIQMGLLRDIERIINDFELGGHVVVATNTTLVPLYAEKLGHSLPNADLITMEDGEQYKSLETVHQIYPQLLAHGTDRNSTLLAFGGGVVGDTMGYVAATFMRGIRLIQMPTTLLSMVDSSVGGKVGVDLPEGKNLVGAFKQPDVVLIDPDTLTTLPDAQWRCGMAEVIKHGLLADTELLVPDLHQQERVSELVERAVRVKVDIVEQDPYEKGIRAHLNLGHTFAHAIERVTHYQWMHGDAVGFGLLAAVKLSHRLGLCGTELINIVRNSLIHLGLPTRLQGIDPDDIYEAMKTDKKWKHGRSRFVLLRDVEKPMIVEDVPKQDVIAILEELV